MFPKIAWNKNQLSSIICFMGCLILHVTMIQLNNNKSQLIALTQLLMVLARPDGMTGWSH